MTNTLGGFNPTLYALAVIEELHKALGLASRVNMGWDAERRTFGKGDTISIKTPHSFTVTDAPATAQDLQVGTTTLVLNNWKEDKFKLTDKELAFTTEEIIAVHAQPMAYALADNVDQALAALVVGVPHTYVEPSAATAATVAGILNTRKALFDLKAPLYDEPNMNFMVGSKEELDLLTLSAFTQWQGAGPVAVDAQIRGYLGKRFGFNFFANQNRTTAAFADVTDKSGTLGAAASVGDTTINVAALDASGVYSKGAVITFTVSGQQYAIASDATMSSGANTAVALSSPIRAAESNSAVFTVETQHDNVTNNLNVAFHKSAFALAFGKLPEVPGQLGAKIASIQDPVTGLAVRSRMYYVGNSSEVHVACDILYGVKMTQPNAACRYEIKNS